MSAECCESFARTDVREETIPDSRSCRAKPRALNEMLQRVTERRLAEADRRVLSGLCCWTRLAIMGVRPTGMYCFYMKMFSSKY